MTDLSKRVAIVGLGLVFPGASDTGAFWEIVAAARDATGDAPPERWGLDPQSVFDPGVGVPDRVYSLRGGFIPDLGFDPAGLAVDSDLCRRLDPMFHLALHAGRAAWRDARTGPVDRGRVGVVLGNIVLPTETTSALTRATLGRERERAALGSLADRLGLASEETPPEPLNRLAAGLPAALLARALGLGGGSYTLDAACASSLYALKLACDELTSRRADAMLTGGLSRPDPLYTQMGFSQLRALSPSGRARPFDGRGDGLVVGEGCGVFVLKRLDDALRHGDTIYGVVAGAGLSNDVDGGLLAPSSEGQLRAMRSAYEQAGWDPRDVDLIECHATGTPVGDAVEFGSLRALWGESGWDPGRCVIGSHKANFGHALTASGAAGLAKLLLALRHRHLPPTANFVSPGPKLGLEGSPFRVLTAGEPWGAPRSGRPRRAAVSGFGFGGINAHVLIEEWAGTPRRVAVGVPTGLTPVDRDEPVAVVGLGVRCGNATALDAFLRMTLGPGSDGTDLHIDEVEVPVGRFRIPPRELEEMLPQQTLALLAAADAIADAGWSTDRPRLRTGVFIGIGLDLNTTNFTLRWSAGPAVARWADASGIRWSETERDGLAATVRDAAGPHLTANRTMGALGGLIASRVAREFRLGGPSFSVSSEETSGPHALEVAVGRLRRGELDEAVVGAVDLTGDPRVAATPLGPEPPRRGDAAAALVLKPLSHALRDGDRIHAVIRDVNSVVAAGDDQPSLAGPRASGWTFDERSTPEAGPSPPDLSHTPVQNVIGHTGAAAGFLSVVRAVAALSSRLLPPSADGAVGPRYWLHDRAEGPRLAQVVAAGSGGNVCEVTLEERPESARGAWTAAEPAVPTGAGLFSLEAEDEAGLRAALDALESLAAEQPRLTPVEAVARDWWAESRTSACRRRGLAILATDVDDLREAIAEARAVLAGRRAATPGSPETSRVFYNPVPLGPDARVAFVYPGIGNHAAGMGRALSARWPEVFDRLDAETLRLRSQLAPASGWDEGAPGVFDDHRAPILGQVVFGTLTTDLLARFGVRPDAVMGYSLGESTALFATRAWSDRDGMHARLDASPLFRNELAGPCHAAARAWGLPAGTPADWAAALVPAGPDRVRDAIGRLGDGRVYLLIVNTPEECVVGGERSALDRLADVLARPFLPLPVVSAVHCAVARQVEAAYCDLHRLPTTPPPGVRFYSGGWGRAYVPDLDTAAEAIVAQALDTLDFPRVVRAAHDDGLRVFVEAGPGQSCTRMVRTILADRPHLAVSAGPPSSDPVVAVLATLGQLIAERVPVDLGPLYGRGSRDVAPTVTAGRPTLRVPVGRPPFEVSGVAERLEDVVNSHVPQPSPVFEPPEPTPEFEPVSFPPAVDDDSLTPSFQALMTTRTLETRTTGPAADPVLAQALATEVARGEAHGAYLRSAADLGRTMANALAFQNALLEALAGTPGAGEALDPRRTVYVRTPEPVAVGAPRGDEPPTQREQPEAPVEPFANGTHATTPPVVFDRRQCLEFAVGSIGAVLGPEFAAVDAYPTRVRLPDEPLMLVDRITALEGEPRTLSHGRIVTEHDVVPGDWYLDQGKVPPCIAIESGQADLFLSAWLGADFETRGEAVYRLLDAAVTFHRALPEPGDVIRYDIQITRFFRQGDTHLFRFQFEGSVDGEPLLTMRDGCAGFFSPGELAAGQGIVRRPLDLRPLPGKRPDDWRDLAPMAVESYNEAQVEALRRGDLAAAFGPAFAGLACENPTPLPGGRMTLVHRIPLLDPTGGRYGLGLIRSDLDIHPGDWFLTCHFVDDQVMPGTLMYECCLHALRIYLTRLGWVGEAGSVTYEPVPGVASRLRCRGQVVETTGTATFEVVIKELGYGPEPFAIADALMYADGKPIVEVTDMTLRLAGLDREAVERVWAGRDRVEPVAVGRPAVFTRQQVLAFAEGNPSEAFGEPYRPFDRDRFIARLPRPPYSFLDRVVSTTAEPFVMKAGGEAVVEYDVPPDAWYFAAERQAVMPFAVLQEISLQACGWLAAYMGSALASPEDMAFRNLGGEAVTVADVTPASGTLTTRLKATRVSHSGGIILQHYDFETFAGDTPVYRGSTYFGFFRREALADQVGIREAEPYAPADAERARGRAFAYPVEAPFPDDRLRMIDQITLYVPDGGPAGLGYVEGTLDVDPSAWFFEAHFYRDPVCPGSLGLESFLQLLKVVAAERWGGGAGDWGFESPATGATHRWVYRGQVVPADRTVTVRAAVTGVDDDRREVTADGFLSVDGRVIYQMIGFSLRLRPAAG